MRTDSPRSGTPAPLRFLAACCALLLPLFPAAAATFIVSNNGDSGAGTLRNALTSCAPGDTIRFNGAMTITPLSPLASTCGGASINANLVSGVTIDGSALSTLVYPACGVTLAGASAMNVYALSFQGFQGLALCGLMNAYGNEIHANAYGVNLSAGSVFGDGTSSGRNKVYGNTNDGVEVAPGGSVTIAGNWIGTADGTTSSANTVGISVVGDAATAITIDNNLVSGNGQGISLQNVGAATLTRNLVGTDATGSAALANDTGITLYATGNVLVDGNVVSGNTSTAITISFSTGTTTLSNNKVGTDTTGARALANAYGIQANSPGAIQVGGNNVVSGNTNVGLGIYNASPGASVAGNFIGTDATGFAAIPNGTGASIGSGSGVMVDGNVISGNTGPGLLLASVSGGTVQNNKIGVAADGASALANGTDGLAIDFCDCISPATGNLITHNTIANNGLDGVAVIYHTGHRISQNSIYNNGNKNIDINRTIGILPNDAGDTDLGPNDQQNYPVINAIVPSGSDTMINVSVDFEPDTYTIEVFENPAAGAPAGKTYVSPSPLPPLDFTFTGPTTFSFVIPGLHDNISLTAIRSNGDTSELSPMVAMTPVPAVTVAPAALNFGSITAGATSAPQTATLTSSGTADYQIFSIDTAGSCPLPALAAPKVATVCATGAFICSTTCATLTNYAPGTSCQVTAQYAPIAAGTDSATIYVCDNTSASPHTITLSGSSVPATVTVTPSSYNFGNVFIGQAGVVTFTITNATAGTATLAAPVASAGFVAQSTTCGATLAASASCSAQVAFTPTAPGLVTGSFTVQSGTTVSVPLSGTGVTPPVGAITVNPSSFGFGSVVVGQSAATTFTISNPGSAAAPLAPLATSGPFAVQSTTCGTTLAAAGSCTASVAFTPSAIGAASGSLTVVSSNTVTVPLSGSGVAPPPVVAVNPPSYSFGDTLVGQAVTATFTVSNPSAAAVALGAITASGPFAIASSTCGASLAPFGGCTVDVAFTPPQPGTPTGSFTIASASAGAAPVTVSLIGFGIQQAVLALPASIDLGTYVIGAPAASYTLELRNTGNAILTFSTVSTAAPFSLVNDCPLNLADTPCTVTILFTTATPGIYNGTLTIVTNAPGGSRNIALTARAQPVPLPVLQVDPRAVGFGERLIGTTSSAQRVTITNVGGAEAHLSFSGPGFDFVTGANTCGATLAPQASCFADVAFRPLGAGPRVGALTVNGDDAGSPHTVSLAGTGCRPFSAADNRAGSRNACAP